MSIATTSKQRCLICSDSLRFDFIRKLTFSASTLLEETCSSIVDDASSRWLLCRDFMRCWIKHHLVIRRWGIHLDNQEEICDQ